VWWTGSVAWAHVSQSPPENDCVVLAALLSVLVIVFVDPELM
jgi:hypothetical protein